MSPCNFTYYVHEKHTTLPQKYTAVVPISNLLTLDRVILQADIRVTEAGTSITFSETKHAPFQVFNHTPRVLQMRQAASSPDLQGTTLSMVSSWDGSFVNVLPGQSTEFFWSDLLGEPKVQIRFAPIGERGDEPSSSSALVAPPRRPRSGSIRTRGVGGFRETVAPGLGSGSTASSPDSPVFMERTGAGIGTSTHLFGDSQDSAPSGGAMSSHETVQLLGPGPTSQLFTSRGISSSQVTLIFLSNPVPPPHTRTLTYSLAPAAVRMKPIPAIMAQLHGCAILSHTTSSLHAPHHRAGRWISWVECSLLCH